jgi:uncharacterized membrane protein
MAKHPRWVRKFVSEVELDAVARAIAEVEAVSSAEVRVHLDHRCPGEAMAQAVGVFERLGMHRTALRHGVLIYVAIADRKLAVIGDQGIHARVGDEYWRGLVATITGEFRQGHPGDGLVTAVRDLRDVLATHFPRRPDDQNELSDEVSIGP